jgi:hypothetical protein
LLPLLLLLLSRMHANHQTELGFPPEALEPLDVAEPIPCLPSPALPPFNGHGTLEDSRQNCVALVPKPPKKVCSVGWGGGASAGRPCPAGSCALSLLLSLPPC